MAVRTVKSHNFSNEHLATGGRKVTERRQKERGGEGGREGGHQRNGSIAADNQSADLYSGV